MGPYSNFKNKNYFHITAKKESLSKDLQAQWQLCLSELNSLASELRMNIHALVMMSNHFHAIICLQDIGQKSVLKERLETFWQGDIHFEKIKSFYEYKQVYYYIYRNPVEAGLVSKCEDYHFSSLSQLLKQKNADLFVIDQMCILANPIDRLRWLNEGVR